MERALFVGILENLSHICPNPVTQGRNRYHLQYTYQYAVFALSPAGTDLLLIVTISIIINKLTMINIATASRSDIIIIVRLLLLLLFHINNIYMEYEYMREILYATGYNKEKKRIRRSYCPGYSILFFYWMIILLLKESPEDFRHMPLLFH